MAAERILIDSTICIEYFRKKNKAKAILYHIVDEFELFVSIITTFEVKVGLVSEAHHRDYKIIMEKIQVFPLDDACIDKAVETFHQLRSTNSQIGLADLLIGATAASRSFRLATLNRKHFERIPGLQLIDLSKYKR